jgi:hypothetical protein
MTEMQELRVYDEASTACTDEELCGERRPGDDGTT